MTFTLGIIGGSGWIGGALTAALLAKGGHSAGSILISSRSEPRERGDVLWLRDNQALVEAADVVVVAVRPDQFKDVAVDARGKLLVSVMAAVSVKALRRQTGADKIVRAMPNAAIAIGRSYTPWFASPGVDATDRRRVQAMFAACGEADEALREEDIDIMTGLTGSGPAFPALLAEAMIMHATARGVAPALARKAALAVVAGASQLLLGEGQSPAACVETFIGYDGVVAAALRKMMASGFIESVGAGLAAAERKVVDLAQTSSF